MANVDPLTSSLRNLWNRVTSSGDPPAEPAKTPEDRDATYDHAVALLPAPSVALPALMAKLDPVGEKLDELKATLSGPYRLKYVTVESGAQFRMEGGFGKLHASAKSDDGILLARVAANAGLTSEVRTIQAGRGDPRSIVKLTQGLIDAGLLEGNGKPLATQIHDLQWRFGIGLDCAGYVYRAVAKVHGDPAKLGLKVPLNEDFTGLPWNPHFVRVAGPKDVKPGDVLVLKGAGRVVHDGVETLDPGHNLIVRSRRLVDASREALADLPAARAFAHGKTNLVMLEVDSSFGAGPFGHPSGGVRRDVLLYDETSHAWATCKNIESAKVVTGDVPYGEEALTGFFRPKVSP